MSKKRMEMLKEVFNAFILSKPLSDNELLSKSQELDKLILQYIKESNFAKIVLGKEHLEEFNNMIDKLELFENIYLAMRIVDPVSRKVLTLDKLELYETENICHDFWDKKSMCENCISIKACNEDATVFKTEYSSTKTYIVIAVPITFHEKKIALELIKEIKGSLYEEIEKSSIDKIIDILSDEVYHVKAQAVIK